MSDGPSKVVPAAEPLDEIILGDDDATTELRPPPPVQPKPSSPPPLRPSTRPTADRSSGPVAPSAPVPARSSSTPIQGEPEEAREPKPSQGRRRAKMTLRIPDDEVSRPQVPMTTPAGGVPAIGTVSPNRPSPGSRREVLVDAAQPVTAGALDHDAVLAADGTLEEDEALRPQAIPSDTGLGSPPVAPAVGLDSTHDPGWTPFQPPVIQPTPIVEVSGPEADARHGLERDRTLLDRIEVDGSRPSQPPISEEIPVDTDLSEIPPTSSDEVATHPRLPVTLDSEEIKLDDGERVSEPGEVEVAPEDLMSVESLPSNTHPPPPVRAAGRPSLKADGAAPTATALMQGVVPPASPSRPQALAVPPVVDASLVAQVPLSGTPPPGQIHPTPAHVAAPNTAATQSSAAAQHLSIQNVAPAQATQPASPSAPSSPPGPRSSNPLIFVPPVGGLAPPPMTDTAAQRKKTRPWWEELFNDDFIRTMAKVTDAQIDREVNFIEESLGCEAGAMILDLACGTGRHAVELAARGYQVVGFDLSLAMLARASDEAQDRKQKINFVQGDMREMTFEETFDGVYSWNTSFGYFDEEKNGAVVARVHRALKKGGQFLLDVVNRDYIVRQAPSLAWFEGDGCICMDEMTIDFITSRMKVKRTLMMDDGRTKEIEYSIRTYALHELGKMLNDNGFRVAEVSGRTGTPGVFFGCESPRTLILAEKR